VIGNLLERYFKDINKRIVFFSCVFLLFAFACVFWSGRYPMIRRDNVVTQTNYWLLISTIASVLVMYPLNRLLYVFKQEVRIWSTSFSHWLLFGFSALLIFAVTPIIVNGWPDTSPRQSHVAVITGKSTISTRGSTSYYLWLRDWDNPTQQFKFEVTQSFYEQKGSGDMIEVATHRGFLNYQWVADYE
jgi:hypothetical protein